MSSSRYLVPIAMALLAVAPSLAAQGLADPRTTIQSLPGSPTALHIIDEPGSYVLGGDLVGEVGQHGVLVEADDVTIDLAGFRLAGVAGALVALSDGEDPGAPRQNIAVFGGHVSGWATGLSLAETTYGLVEDLTVGDNGTGLRVGSEFLVHDVRLRSNTEEGIRAEEGISILDSVLEDHPGGGLFVGFDPDATGTLVADCRLLDSSAASASGPTLVTGTQFHATTSVPIQGLLDPGPASLVTGCTLRADLATPAGWGLWAEEGTLAFENEFSGFLSGLATSQSSSWFRHNVFSDCWRALDSSVGTNLVTNNTAIGSQSSPDFLLSATCTYGVVIDPTLVYFSDLTPWANVVH